MHSANPNRGNASSLRNRLKTAESPVVHASEVDVDNLSAPILVLTLLCVLGQDCCNLSYHSTMHAHWTCI